MSRTDREFDLVLWGATGFTGQLTAAHLHEHYGDGRLRWAIGGRDEAKLDALRRDLGVPDLPVVVGDSLDRRFMDSLANRTRVVCSTVGPYAKYGSEPVAACAAAGTDYCDLTGEIHWIRRMMDAHHAEAGRTGARIVPVCGVDSIPSDLGVFLLHKEMLARHGRPSPRVTCGVAAFQGGFSGGTAASLLNVMEQLTSDAEVRRIYADPYSINPEGSRRGPERRERLSPAYDRDFGSWTAPFVMAGVNRRVVRRTAALLPDLYGPEFRYDEAMLTGRGLGGMARAAAISAGTAGLMLSMAIGPVRRVVARRFPQPGEGPSREQREKGYWEFRFRADPLRLRIRGDRDPGYGSTSKMLAESAVCLALDRLEAEGGFHTPASAMGEALIRRLQERAGITFDLETG